VPSDLELLQSILLEITQAKRMDVVLPLILAKLVDNADFALARIWLAEMAGPYASGPRTVSTAFGEFWQVQG